MREKTVRVLLVDDDEDEYVLTRDIFAETEGVRFKLDWVSAYEEALGVVAENRHQVYLFDYRLGERDGLELLRECREKGCKAPIILLTGQGDRTVDVKAMQSGAADYLVKGRFDGYLLERAIRYAINHTATLDKLRESQKALKEANQRLEEAMENIDEELEMARLIQRSMLPVDYDHVPGVRIATQYVPCEKIGGDFFDIIQIDDTRVAFLILDVVGHGVPAALVTSMAKTTFSRNITSKNPVGQVFERVNHEVMTNLREERNLTAFLGILDTSTFTFTFARAGHPPPMLIRPGAKAVQYLNAPGMSIGFVYDVAYDEKQIRLSSGDKIIMYTDGLTESQNEKEQRFSRKRLEAILVRNSERTANEVSEEIQREYVNFTGNVPQMDDIAMLVVEVV